MSRKSKGPSYRETFAAKLMDLARAHPDALPRAHRRPAVSGYRPIELDINTSHMSRHPDGMPAQDVETVVVCVSQDPTRPPIVYVEHPRFTGVPHVLHDGQLCIYLDPSREWDPQRGAAGLMERLFDWFEDAIAGRFDPTTALFHAVGGMSHTNRVDPLVVCQQELDLSAELSFAWLVTLSPRRAELRSLADEAHAFEKVLVVRLSRPLYTGPGATLTQLLQRDGMPAATKVAEAWLNRIKQRLRDGQDDVHIVLAVPNPGSAYQLLVGRLGVAEIQSAAANGSDLPLEWCSLSDERPSISRRRDDSRPVNAYNGIDAAVIGCGGLGSWIAEFVVRAGARSIELVDYARVNGGLLVRQNYVDADIAVPKAEALAQRLRAITPHCSVTHSIGSLGRVVELMQQVGAVVIDATVNRALAQQIEVISRCADRRATVAQVTTDVRSGSLGMVVVSNPGAPGPLSLDDAAGEVVSSLGQLEHYRTFWEPRDEDELIPALGCSIPTFHGSAADMAAVAAEHVNLIALHIGTSESGTHLFALPHTGISPNHHFIPPGARIDGAVHE